MSSVPDIRSYQNDDARVFANLFHNAVHAIDPSLYSEAQKEAWAPTPPDYVSWKTRLAETQPFIATLDNQIVGFVELEADGHIDCFYVHPDHQRKGVAQALFGHLLAAAKTKRISRLYVEASKVAKPFFLKNGFVVMSENQVERRGQVLINFSMERRLVT